MAEPKYTKPDQPFVVPTTDGKLIEEHFGLASTKEKRFSVARMVAPPGWSEPYQKPDFDEVTVVICGKKRIEIDGEEIDLGAGESIMIRAGTTVRYSNPFDTEVMYWSFCIPAFSPQSVNRQTE